MGLVLDEVFTHTKEMFMIKKYRFTLVMSVIAIPIVSMLLLANHKIKAKWTRVKPSQVHDGILTYSSS